MALQLGQGKPDAEVSGRVLHARLAVVLQLGQGKPDAEVGGSVLHAMLHPRCRGLWPRRNTAQAFEDLVENVHSFAKM